MEMKDRGINIRNNGRKSGGSILAMQNLQFACIYGDDNESCTSVAAHTETSTRIIHGVLYLAEMG